MVEIEELKSVLLLTYLKDAMLKKVAEIAQTRAYQSGDYIFREGDDTDSLYAICEGKVGLEIEKNSSTRVLVDTLPKGRTFGFSALVDTEEKKYTLSAKAMAETKVFIWKAEDLETLFHQNQNSGYLRFLGILFITKATMSIISAPLPAGTIA